MRLRRPGMPSYGSNNRFIYFIFLLFRTFFQDHVAEVSWLPTLFSVANRDNDGARSQKKISLMIARVWTALTVNSKRTAQSYGVAQSALDTARFVSQFSDFTHRAQNDEIETGYID